MTEPVRKSERTRARILAAALELFREKGYAETTTRDIADRAGCALGLLYRYFPRRESFVLALYDQITSGLGDRIAQLPDGTVADRFARAMHEEMERLEPHRDAFVGLVGAALDRRSGAAVLGPESAETRARVESAFRDLVRGSTDAPTDDRAEGLARLLFVAQLLMILVWTQDTSTDAHRSHHFVDLGANALRAATPMLPIFDPALTSLTALVGEFFDDAAE